MDALRALVQSLDETEIRRFRVWGRMFKNPQNDWPKRIELFDLLVADSARSDVEAARSIYKSLPGAAFSHLKKHLYDSLLKFLLNYESLPAEDQAYANEKRCWQLLAQARLLHRRGLSEAAISRLHQAKLITDQYDLVYEKTMADEMLRSGFASSAGSDLYEGFSLEVKHDHDRMGKYLQALELADRVLYPNAFFLMEREEYLSFAEDVIDILKGFWADTHSPRIRIMYQRVAAKYSELKSDWPAAIDCLQAALEMLDEQTALSNSQLKKELQMQLLALLLRCNHATEAVTLARKMLLQLQPAHEDFFTVYNLILKVELQLGHTRAVEQCVQEVYTHIRVVRADDHLFYQWELNKALLLWMQKCYSDCLQQLQRMMKRGGNSFPLQFSYRYMELLCLLETGDVDRLVYRIETFRSFLNKNKLHQTRRNEIILRLLSELVKSGIHFRQVVDQCRPLLLQLQQNANELHWSPLSPEPVRFDEWLNAHHLQREQAAL